MCRKTHSRIRQRLLMSLRIDSPQYPQNKLRFVSIDKDKYDAARAMK